MFKIINTLLNFGIENFHLLRRDHAHAHGGFHVLSKFGALIHLELPGHGHAARVGAHNIVYFICLCVCVEARLIFAINR